MAISDVVTKPFRQAILGKQEDAQPAATLEDLAKKIADLEGKIKEAQVQIKDLDDEIEELEGRAPTTSPELEQERIDLLAVKKRNKQAWVNVLAGLVAEKKKLEIVVEGIKAQQATAAARHWPPADTDVMWAGWLMVDKRWALATAEYQATAQHSYLKSDGKYSIGESPQQDILQKARDFYMDMMEALNLPRKVSPSRGVYSLARIEKGK